VYVCVRVWVVQGISVNGVGSERKKKKAEEKVFRDGERAHDHGVLAKVFELHTIHIYLFGLDK
jgi:hypothetical protein